MIGSGGRGEIRVTAVGAASGDGIDDALVPGPILRVVVNAAALAGVVATVERVVAVVAVVGGRAVGIIVCRTVDDARADAAAQIVVAVEIVPIGGDVIGLRAIVNLMRTIVIIVFACPGIAHREGLLLDFGAVLIDVGRDAAQEMLTRTVKEFLAIVVSAAEIAGIAIGEIVLVVGVAGAIRAHIADQIIGGKDAHHGGRIETISVIDGIITAQTATTAVLGDPVAVTEGTAVVEINGPGERRAVAIGDLLDGRHRESWDGRNRFHCPAHS